MFEGVTDLTVGQCKKSVWDRNGSVAPKHPHFLCSNLMLKGLTEVKVGWCGQGAGVA